MSSGGALFGGGRPREQSKYLVEFRAGKMTMNPSDKMVTPDKRRGMVMVQQTEDQLMHFMWKDRTSGSVEDDLIIFPDDVEFKRVKQCTTGRVYLLKFKSSGSRNMFFWMQEPKTDKDEEYCKKVNDYLNHPPAPGSGGGRSGGSGLSALGLGGSGGGVDLNNLGDAELQSLLNNMSQQQLMQLFGGGLSGGGLASLLGGGSPSGGRQRSSAR